MTCPLCQSTRVKRTTQASLALALFVGGGCLLWVPVIGWLIGLALLVLAVVALLGGLSGGRPVYQCERCGHAFRGGR